MIISISIFLMIEEVLQFVNISWSNVLSLFRPVT